MNSCTSSVLLCRLVTVGAFYETHPTTQSHNTIHPRGLCPGRCSTRSKLRTLSRECRTPCFSWLFDVGVWVLLVCVSRASFRCMCKKHGSRTRAPLGLPFIWISQSKRPSALWFWNSPRWTALGSDRFTTLSIQAARCSTIRGVQPVKGASFDPPPSQATQCSAFLEQPRPWMPPRFLKIPPQATQRSMILFQPSLDDSNGSSPSNPGLNASAAAVSGGFADFKRLTHKQPNVPWFCCSPQWTPS
jgi:hypothetical protein